MLKNKRKEKGLTQTELAEKAGLSRTAIAYIEAGTMVPSVNIALSIARVLESSVEEIFGSGNNEVAWAWAPESLPHGFWQVRVGKKLWRIPCEQTPIGILPCDGYSDSKKIHMLNEQFTGRTIVIACCDPAIGILAELIQKQTGWRVIPLYRSSAKALELLKKNQVHFAGMHFADKTQSSGNKPHALQLLGGGYHILHYAVWESGVAILEKEKYQNGDKLLKPEVRWLGREEGTGARLCQEIILGKNIIPEKTARDHAAVAFAVSNGWADAGICQAYAARLAKLELIPVRREVFDLCYSEQSEKEPFCRIIKEIVGSRNFRQLLNLQAGYDTSESGESDFMPAQD
jgi:molybdate-binding protein/DNA-binding XRE family transcriptional regulator